MQNTTLLPTEWRSAHLTVAVPLKLPEPYGTLPPVYQSNRRSDAFGFNMLSMLVSSRSSRIPDEFELPPYAEAVFLERVNFRRYGIAKITLRLKKDAISTFFCETQSYKQFDEGYYDRVGKLVTALAVSLRLEPFYGEAGYSSVLSLEPIAALPLSPSDQLQIAKELWDKVGHGVHLPSLLYDVFICESWRNSCVMVRTSPFQSHDNFQGVLLPVAVNDMLNHDTFCRIAAECAHDLRTLPVLTNDFWTMKTRFGSHEGYRNFYLRERQATEDAVLDAEEFLDGAELQLPVRYLYDQRFKEWPEEFPLNGLADLTKSSIHALLPHEKSQATHDVNSAMSRLKRRLALLDSYLRDSAQASSTDTDLRLARSVHRLTWIASFVAFASIAVGLLPDSARETAWTKLFGNVSDGATAVVATTPNETETSIDTLPPVRRLDQPR